MLVAGDATPPVDRLLRLSCTRPGALSPRYRALGGHRHKNKALEHGGA